LAVAKGKTTVRSEFHFARYSPALIAERFSSQASGKNSLTVDDRSALEALVPGGLFTTFKKLELGQGALKPALVVRAYHSMSNGKPWHDSIVYNDGGGNANQFGQGPGAV
jgi:hypothetical protein